MWHLFYAFKRFLTEKMRTENVSVTSLTRILDGVQNVKFYELYQRISYQVHVNEGEKA